MGIAERKARERQRRYNEILDAAERLFFRHGFNQVSMDDIAKEAELAKGTLYLYFTNREDLHYGIVMRGVEVINRLIHDEYDPDISGIQNISKIGDAYVRFFNEYPDYFKAMFYFDASQFEKVKTEQKMKLLDADSPLLFFADVVKQGQEDGTIALDIPATELAIILWAQILGVFEFIAMRGPILGFFDIEAETLIHNHFNVLANGLQKKQTV